MIRTPDTALHVSSMCGSAELKFEARQRPCAALPRAAPKKSLFYINILYCDRALSKALAGTYHPHEAAHNARRNIFLAF
ncbi:hypothetical protein HAP41_0000014330 [Bradyrhizobium barranii subsp. apii]|uniref:Uncharacterized protein n=1 Tax=Bradyrhizobium barranii subsp. apii TaxID=2819348 RepID=A0A8U0FY93_9BRAD|nr:hypothetical protein [Bradyrhizobium barranii]UPT92084.1 hypothetical protein HAP41_0000014330 [Bradyrhizobium barranii subsp. apii]